jgi:hypothetical protein
MADCGWGRLGAGKLPCKQAGLSAGKRVGDDWSGEVAAVKLSCRATRYRPAELQRLMAGTQPLSALLLRARRVTQETDNSTIKAIAACGWISESAGPSAPNM